MSARPPEQAPSGTDGHEMQVEAIVFNEHERELWRGIAQILEEPISVVYRICALSGAEHYLAELGKMEQAAMAGALLRIYAESKGIEVEEHEPHTREVQISGKQKHSRGRHAR